jgi:hypothetical protein
MARSIDKKRRRGVDKLHMEPFLAIRQRDNCEHDEYINFQEIDRDILV